MLLKYLINHIDENVIIRLAAKVQEGDILIGKGSPKGETDPTPEEKLLKAIFGEKAGEVKDSSRRADPGVQGIVLNTKLFQNDACLQKLSKVDRNLDLKQHNEFLFC